MAFITASKGSLNGYGGWTFNFNKNINQYFIGGVWQENTSSSYKEMCRQFICVYNNGNGGGQVDDTSYPGDINCSANSIYISKITNTTAVLNGMFIAVIIYPAKYGDVTIS